MSDAPLGLIEFVLQDGTEEARVAIIAATDDARAEIARALGVLSRGGFVQSVPEPGEVSAEVSSLPDAKALIHHIRARSAYAAILDAGRHPELGHGLYRALFESVRDRGLYGVSLRPPAGLSIGVLGSLRLQRPEWARALTSRSDDASSGNGDGKGHPKAASNGGTKNPKAAGNGGIKNPKAAGNGGIKNPNETAALVALRTAAGSTRRVPGMLLVTKVGDGIDVPLASQQLGSTAGEVDLGGVYRLSGIRAGDDIPLHVEVSHDGRSWIEVKTRLKDGTHRFVREVYTRYLRASGEDWTVLTRHRDHRAKAESKFVTARRPDGLGGRLAAVLHAIRLGRILGLDYRIHWNDGLADDPHHAVPQAEQVFEAEYWLRRAETDRLVSGIRSVKPKAKGAPTRTVETLLDELVGAYGFAAPLERLDRYIDAAGISDPYLEEFEQIGFSPAISRAIDIARNTVLPPNAVGLHLRSGDIVFGSYRRFFVHTRKVIAYPIAKALIRELERRGHTVVLFGENDMLAEGLASGSRVIKAQDLIGRFEDATAQALAEIILLSRFDLVVARNSAFAEQAASIGGKPLVDPAEYFPPEQQVRITEEELATSDLDPLSRAFAYWSAYYLSRRTMSASEAVRMIRLASAADPANPLYPLTAAAVLFGDGRVPEGEETLRAALDAEFPSDMGTAISTFTLRMGGWFLLDELFPFFERAAEKGSEVARQFIDARDEERELAATRNR